MGSVGNRNNSSTQTAPDEFGGALGERKVVKDVNERLTYVLENSLINPNYRAGRNGEYERNCALCSVALALQARGYDVEAMPRDKDWRGLDSVFDVDYNNPDNFIASGSKYRVSGVPSAQQIYLQNKNYADKSDVPQVPRGAKNVAKAVIDKAKGWGEGAIGAINVKWKDTSSAHTLNIVNIHGNVWLVDSQSGKVVFEDKIEKYLKRTIANHTSIVRLDNAPIKKDIKNLDKMVKQRDFIIE